MGLRIDYSKNGKTYQNAYVNCRFGNVRQINDLWKMDIIINVFTEDKELGIEPIFTERQIPHTPGMCIHQESYAHIKTMPKFLTAIDDI